MKQNLSTFFIVLISLSLISLNLFFAINIISENYNFQNPLSLNSLNEFRVIDGDTFTYNNTIIRLLCIQTPEKDQPGYQESSSYLSSLLSQGQIQLQSLENIDKDMYNRSLRFVYVNNGSDTLFINKLMIDNNFAFLFPFNNTNCSLLE